MKEKPFYESGEIYMDIEKFHNLQPGHILILSEDEHFTSENEYFEKCIWISNEGKIKHSLLRVNLMDYNGNLFPARKRV